MNNSFSKLCLLLIFVLPFVLFGIILDDAYAEEKQIFSKSISFETTSILEFTNHGTTEIKTITVWLGDSSFVSFKPQNDWSSSTASEKSITFVTLDPLKTNETVKFGIKTESSYPFVQWKAFDKDNVLVESGISLSENIPSFLDPQEQKSPEDPVILSNSTFKVIPTNLHPGSTVRVTGSDFAPHSSLTLFPFEARSKSFVTDENGHFMLTLKIPENQKPEKINFILKDNQENEKTIGLFVTEIEQEFLHSFNFTVFEIENKFTRSDRIKFLGTANPDSSIIIKIKDPQNNPFSTKVQRTDSNGQWSVSTLFSPITPLGTYSAEITDGKNIR